MQGVWRRRHLPAWTETDAISAKSVEEAASASTGGTAVNARSVAMEAEASASTDGSAVGARSV